MKKILLLFTSFLFTSNLILLGADSFGAAPLPCLERMGEYCVQRQENGAKTGEYA